MKVRRNIGRAHRQIELVAAQITPGVGRLDDHLLAGDGTAGEGQLVASAAPAALAATGDVYGGETVGQVVADRPRALARAHVRRTPVAAGGGIRVREWLVVDVARRHRGRNGGFAGPGTGALTAVPVASCDAGARGLSCAKCSGGAEEG